jgi:hypothetical protein
MKVKCFDSDLRSLQKENYYQQGIKCELLVRYFIYFKHLTKNLDYFVQNKSYKTLVKEVNFFTLCTCPTFESKAFRQNSSDTERSPRF